MRLKKEFPSGNSVKKWSKHGISPEIRGISSQIGTIYSGSPFYGDQTEP